MATDIWVNGEGDAWYARNARALSDASRIRADVTLSLVATIPPPQSVLEIGCASGWRLDEIQRRYGSACCGVDVAQDAIAAGLERYPDLCLEVGRADYLPFQASAYDLVIFAFTLHWIERSKLAMVVAEADRVLALGGHLIVTDFLPNVPVKNRYHHREDIELWTYKQRYALCWQALGTYREIRRQLFDHDTGALGDCAPSVRAAAVLLRKEEVYRCGSR